MPQKESNQSQAVLYHTADGKVTVNVLFAHDNFWLTQRTMADLFGVKIPAVNKHLKNIYASGELTPGATISKMEIAQIEGGRQISREIEFYNLDAVISELYGSAGASPRRGNLARNGGGEGAWGIRELPGETGCGIYLRLRQGFGAIPERERRTMNRHVNAIAGRLSLPCSLHAFSSCHLRCLPPQLPSPCQVHQSALGGIGRAIRRVLCSPALMRSTRLETVKCRPRSLWRLRLIVAHELRRITCP